MAQNEVLLKVESLSVAYGHINALKEVNLQVLRGEIVVLIGANGAGKTTLLETSLGINTPKSGEITFKGKPISGVPADRNVRAGLCLVPEGRGVFASMSVLDNLLLGAHHNMKNVARNLKRVYQWFPRLEERKNQIARTLSGGERQMAYIAMAVCREPEVIVLDEPTASLDYAHQVSVMDLMEKMKTEKKVTVIMVSHDINLAAMYGDRLLLVKDGRKLCIGKAPDVISGNILEEAYNCDLVFDKSPVGDFPRVIPLPGRYKPSDDKNGEK